MKMTFKYNLYVFSCRLVKFKIIIRKNTNISLRYLSQKCRSGEVGSNWKSGRNIIVSKYLLKLSRHCIYIPIVNYPFVRKNIKIPKRIIISVFFKLYDKNVYVVNIYWIHFYCMKSLRFTYMLSYTQLKT